MGLPLACVFAKHGAFVTVCDVNRVLVSAINAGTCPYEEPDLADLIGRLHASKRLRATCDTATAAGNSDAVVVIVPAHLTRERDIDIGILAAASADVGRGLKRGTLVVYETTVDVGRTRNSLIPILEQVSGLRAGSDFHVAFSPERVKANMVLARLETTPKIVGGLDPVSTDKALRLYATYLGAPTSDVGSIEAAEMAKLCGMLYRDVNIALANELAAYCEIAGIDFERVRSAANSDGEAAVLSPGIGVGGHCTPVYPYFLTRESRRIGLTQRLAEAAREINDGQPARQVARIATAWRPLNGERVHVLGLGFRPGVKVDTFSPAYALRDALIAHGAITSIEDPNYTNDELRRAGFEPSSRRGASVVILNTAHREFAEPDFAAWRADGVEAVLDGRNAWPQHVVEAAGILYLGIGRRSDPDRSQGRAAAERKTVTDAVL
jgi:nucleotide sugar dehydrogenase